MAEVLTIATNSDNDIYMDNFYNIAFSEDKKALSNVVLNAVRTNRGELQYDLSAGIPYFDTLFSNPPNVPMWESFLKQVTLSIPGIDSVESFSYKVTDHVFRYAMTLTTNLGEVTVNG